MTRELKKGSKIREPLMVSFSFSKGGGGALLRTPGPSKRSPHQTQYIRDPFTTAVDSITASLYLPLSLSSCTKKTSDSIGISSRQLQPQFPHDF